MARFYSLFTSFDLNLFLVFIFIYKRYDVGAMFIVL